VRPPTEHVAKLSSDTTGYDTAVDFSLDRSASQRFRFIVSNGDLKAYNISTGAEVSIVFAFGKAYLYGSSFRSTVIGDRAIVLNRDIVTAKNTSTKAPDSTPQALVHVKSADYETSYTITLNGDNYSYKTPSSSATNARTALGTDVIATQLASLIPAQYTVTQYGSVLHIVTATGADFTISAADGLGGIALVAIKGTVQLFSDLPAKAKSGMIVEVTGSPESDVDNYFVQYDDTASASQGGVWKEVVKPGLLVSLDGTTLPHVLEYRGNILGSEPGQGTPKMPAISDGGATELSYGWDQYTDGTPISNPEVDHFASDHNFGFRLSAGAAGAAQTIRTKYDIDVTGLGSDTVTVNLWVEGVLRGTVGYVQSDGTPQEQQIEWTGAYAGGTIELKLSFGSGVGGSAGLTGIGNNPRGPSVKIISGLSSKLTFDTTYKYPAGSTFTVTLNATSFNYVIGATDQTGAQVATGVSALVDADAGFNSTNPSSGVVLMITSGGAKPTTSVSTNFSELTTFHSPNATLTPGGYVGKTIQNVTDGSSAVITSNTATTVVVAALTGGSDNKFQPGDNAAIYNDGDYFTFGPVDWKERAAGDDTSGPFPSFVGRTIDEVFFYQNRLGVTSKDSIVLSGSGDYYNLFRTTVTQLLASDMIDVRSAVRKVAGFNGAVEWTDGLYLASDQDVFRLSGTPTLTPTTVRLDFMGAYQSHPNVRPLALPGHLALASVKNGSTRIAFATIQPRVVDDPMLDFRDITEHVPTYLVGNPIALACDPKAQLIAVVTDGAARRSLYVCLYDINNGQFSQLSWSRWDFPLGTVVVGLNVLNGIIDFVLKRADGAYLESITLDPAKVIASDDVLWDGTYTLNGSFNLNARVN
jgi:hypothetical protein